ncbi:hypothetical protein [Kitasatospora kifunensis]|uniref:Uncharacterized protein n=1 Tax=Kitasatospora kifunensis TaxID=58351 RepID=A0A7W7VZM9_KITKI|nr:hypothetical protein [Kitasatospora kifunensis]MBB4928726.1 hypothetical protein [Kitasatospora kifunensis]
MPRRYEAAAEAGSTRRGKAEWRFPAGVLHPWWESASTRLIDLLVQGFGGDEREARQGRAWTACRVSPRQR